MDVRLPSKVLEDLVNQFYKLPGIGYRTAIKLALHVLHSDKNDVLQFSESFKKIATDTFFCTTCHNLSPQKDMRCEICTSPKRDQSIVCVVETIKDIVAIESLNIYTGSYHVLGGIISPINGISPSDLKLDSLFERIDNQESKEIIFALPTTLDGDTTCFYIHKKIQNKNIQFSTLSRGLSVGDQLEFADKITLSQSFLERVPYEKSNAL